MTKTNLFLNGYKISTRAKYTLQCCKPSTYAICFVLCVVKACDPCLEIYHAPKINNQPATNSLLPPSWKYAFTHTPHHHVVSTLRVRNSIHTYPSATSTLEVRIHTISTIWVAPCFKSQAFHSL